MRNVYVLIFFDNIFTENCSTTTAKLIDNGRSC